MAIIHHFDWKTFNTNNNICLCPHNPRLSTFCSCSSSWETICIWTLAWAVLLSSRMCSATRCFWNSVVSSHRASHPVHLHRPENISEFQIKKIIVLLAKLFDVYSASSPLLKRVWLSGSGETAPFLFFSLVLLLSGLTAPVSIFSSLQLFSLESSSSLLASIMLASPAEPP